MTVLVGVHGPEPSRPAIRVAALEARFRGAELVAVTAYSGERAGAAPTGRPLAGLHTASEERASAETALRDAALDALGPDAAHVQLRVVQGQPGRTLVEAARTLHAELLVLSSRGELSWLFSSQYVLRTAPCPILIVPDRERAV